MMQSWRRRMFAILDQPHHGTATSRFVHRLLIAAVLINIAAAIGESVPRFGAAHRLLFQAIEYVTALVFLAEYVLRLWVAVEHPLFKDLPPARARLTYALQPAAIIDLLAILPALVALLSPLNLRVALIFRLVRFFKLARYSPGLSSLADAVWSERRALQASLIILVGAVLMAASLMHAIEGEEQPDKFGSIPDAMYWAVITLTTIGYGDVYPVTALGKFVTSITAIVGLVMVALPVGIVASAFEREIHRREFIVTWSMIARVPLFAGLDAPAISEIISVLHAQTANAGDAIVRKGEPAHSMYFIAQGEVIVELPQGPVVLATGQFFGEMALLIRADRSATVRARERTSLLVLDAHDFHHIMSQHPDIAQKIKIVAEARGITERRGPSDDKTDPG